MRSRFFGCVSVERLPDGGGKGLELVPNLFQDFGGFHFRNFGAELDLAVELDVFEDGAIVIVGHNAQKFAGFAEDQVSSGRSEFAKQFAEWRAFHFNVLGWSGSTRNPTSP